MKPTYDLTDRVIQLLREHPGSTRRELVQRGGLKTSSTTNRLYRMQRRGQATRVGDRWYLITKVPVIHTPTDYDVPRAVPVRPAYRPFYIFMPSLGFWR